jgi:hypothetical protein
MNNLYKTGLRGPVASDPRIISQAIFIAFSLIVSAGGVWSLYMADAPYHPEVSQAAFSMTTLLQ